MPRYSMQPGRGKSPRRSGSAQATPRYRRAGMGSLSSSRHPRHTGRSRYLNTPSGLVRRPDLGHVGGSRSRNPRRAYAIVVVGCAFLLFIASIVWYVNRSVTIGLNGEDTSVRIGSSLEELLGNEDISARAGDLLAVDDSMIEKGAGERYAIRVDGKKVDAKKTGEVTFSGGENVEVADGADVYEPHDVQATEIQPTLTVEGSGPVGYVETWGIPGRIEVWTGKTSGKTADRGTVKEAVNARVRRTSVTPDKDDGKKYVAITFDEGPSPRTRALLDILDKKGVKATFFLTGSAVEDARATVKAIADSGNEIGSNGYSNTDLSRLSGTELRDEITRGFDEIERAGGGASALLRPSGGLYSDSDWAEAMDLTGAVVTWNIDSGDWLLRGARQVVDTVMGSVGDGDIIMLTDNDATAGQTVEALPLLIDELRQEGYELVTLSGLIATDEDLKGIADPQRVKMPKGAVLPQLPEDGQSS